MAYIPNALRRLVAERARGLCEYCQTAQIVVISMEIDHIVPVTVGGATTAENLCLTCNQCNLFKLAYETGFDLETKEEVALFNPRIQQWSEHFQWDKSGTQLIGLTPTGRATINRLRINQPDALQARQLWVKAGWHPPSLD